MHLVLFRQKCTVFHIVYDSEFKKKDFSVSFLSFFDKYSNQNCDSKQIVTGVYHYTPVN